MMKILKKYTFLVWLLLGVIFSDGSNLDDFVTTGANHFEIQGDLLFSNIFIQQKNHEHNHLKSRTTSGNKITKEKISDIDSPGLPAKWIKSEQSIFSVQSNQSLKINFLLYKTALYLLHCSLLI